MKIKSLLLGILVSAVIGVSSAKANVVIVEDIAFMDLVNTSRTFALINWKVGDSQDYKVSMGFGMEGTMHKEATKEEGNGIWVKTDLKLPIANDTSEILFDRNTAKVLKYIHNGKEEAMPDDKIEIVSTKNDTVTVPAGTFKCLHITAKSEKVPAIEIWMAQRDISLDGSAKMYMDQGMMKITMELTKFVRN